MLILADCHIFRGLYLRKGWAAGAFFLLSNSVH